MLLTRREHLRQYGRLAAGFMPPQLHHQPHQPPPSGPVLDPGKLAPFVDPLPIPPVARQAGTRPSPTDAAVKIPFYRLPMRQITSQVHRDLKPTRCWGIGSSSPGPTLETQKGDGMLVEWANELPGAHFLPIDHRLHGAEADKPGGRAIIHLHGGKVPPESDGYPEDWYAPGKAATYYYPNNQDAALLWYHDHTMGINRLNIFAGLLGLYIIRDPLEDSLNLPRGKYEVPLVLYDRTFDPDGQLNYPVSPTPGEPWIPEFFGNAVLVNGKLLPYLEVEARKYRFRVLNAANGRFFHLSLGSGQELHQIGTDQGLLPAPLPLKQLSLAPGERADAIVDFSGQAGARIVLNNDVMRPVMQLRVVPAASPDHSALPKALRPVRRIVEAEAVQTRTLTLGEIDDLRGDTVTMLLNNTPWHAPISEKPVLNSIEIWNLVNMTDDAHPIHLHLVRFQILDRRRFDAFAYQNQNVLRYTGDVTPPEPGEAGWKDTARADPAMITRIVIPFEGYTGRYVWHCHILEHEDNEMMRPYEVIAAR
ncbi:MAG TPA: multicopper oxidase [Bryobacteraceae bacterium]|nr:multicopper oxidase [Bryobacteraceae bacterium]